MISLLFGYEQVAKRIANIRLTIANLSYKHRLSLGTHVCTQKDRHIKFLLDTPVFLLLFGLFID